MADGCRRRHHALSSSSIALHQQHVLYTTSCVIRDAWCVILRVPTITGNGALLSYLPPPTDLTKQLKKRYETIIDPRSFSARSVGRSVGFMCNAYNNRSLKHITFISSIIKRFDSLRIEEESSFVRCWFVGSFVCLFIWRRTRRNN